MTFFSLDFGPSLVMLIGYSEIAPGAGNHVGCQEIKPPSILGQPGARQTPYHCTTTWAPSDDL